MGFRVWGLSLKKFGFKGLGFVVEEIRVQGVRVCGRVWGLWSKKFGFKGLGSVVEECSRWILSSSVSIVLGFRVCLVSSSVSIVLGFRVCLVSSSVSIVCSMRCTCTPSSQALRLHQKKSRTASRRLVA